MVYPSLFLYCFHQLVFSCCYLIGGTIPTSLLVLIKSILLPLYIIYAIVSAQQMNLLHENSTSQNNSIFAQSLFMLYRVYVQWLSFYGCSDTIVYVLRISISISILECTRAGALGNKPNEALL